MANSLGLVLMSGFVKVGGAACVTPHEGFY